MTEQCSAFSLIFLRDAFRNIDTELHLSVLMCDRGWWKALLTVLHVTQTERYAWVINGALCVLIFLGVKQQATEAAHLWLYIVLCLDSVQHTLFNALLWKGLTYAPEGADKPIVLDHQLKRKLLLILLYPAILTLATVSAVVSISGEGNLESVTMYCLTVMTVLRNPEIWPALSLFSNAMLSTAPVAYLFICMWFVISALATVLFHGEYQTGDFYTDYQFNDMFTTTSTMFIYLAVGENYVESVEPALSNHGAYALFFVICSLLGPFLHYFTFPASIR